MTLNLAKQYLRDHNETVDDWDGLCGELANAVMGPGAQTLWIEGDIPWGYHMVPLIDGLVHDAWCEREEALPPREWLVECVGPGGFVEVSLNGDVIFEGVCKNFVLPRSV